MKQFIVTRLIDIDGTDTDTDIPVNTDDRDEAVAYVNEDPKNRILYERT